jgi:L-serine dehydratase
MNNILDIIGPVMIGPSSSHTAGACRLGLLARGVLGQEPMAAELFLHGSFARTYKGHGTDLALLAGLMGWLPDDIRIPKAMEYAREAGLQYEFETVNLGELVHPNTVRFRLTGKEGAHCQVTGSSIGGGQVLVSSIDGTPVELTGKLPTLLVPHRDQPGVIAQVSSALAAHGVNIASMRVFRDNKGGRASMVLECDQAVTPEVLAHVAEIESVTAVRFINKVL